MDLDLVDGWIYSTLGPKKSKIGFEICLPRGSASRKNLSPNLGSYFSYFTFPQNSSKGFLQELSGIEFAHNNIPEDNKTTRSRAMAG